MIKFTFFLKFEVTVSDLITSFLKLTLGNTYFSLKDYSSYIVFKGVKICQYTVIMNSFKTKKDNNIIYVMRQALKTIKLYLSNI